MKFRKLFKVKVVVENITWMDFQLRCISAMDQLVNDWYEHNFFHSKWKRRVSNYI